MIRISRLLRSPLPFPNRDQRFHHVCHVPAPSRRAEAVVKLVNDNQVADYTVSSPILYLYRHSFELYLKCLIEASGGKPGREHDLAKLLAMAPCMPDWMRNRILELHAVDPRSTHLRYGHESGQFPGPEGWAEINFLRDAMRALRADSG